MEEKVREKRRFPRIGLRVPVSYRIRGMARQLATLSRNVSAGGMGLVTDQFLAADTLINLEFSVLQKFFSLYARTKWVSSLPSSDSYLFGLEFLELQPKDKDYLSDYVTMQEQKL